MQRTGRYLGVFQFFKIDHCYACEGFAIISSVRRIESCVGEDGNFCVGGAVAYERGYELLGVVERINGCGAE